MTVAYINLYKQGFYHRAGKPGTMEVHPGDMYATREAATADINHDAPYVGTFVVFLGAYEFGTYPEHSEPVSLRESRKWFAPSTTQDMIDWDPATPGNLPITHNVGETFTAAPSHVQGLRPLTAFEERYAAVEEDDSDGRYDYPAATAIETGDGYEGPTYAEWKRQVQP